MSRKLNGMSRRIRYGIGVCAVAALLVTTGWFLRPIQAEAPASPGLTPDQMARMESLSDVFRTVARQAQAAVVFITCRSTPEAKQRSGDEEDEMSTEDLPDALRQFFEQHGGQPFRFSPRDRMPGPRTGSGSGVVIDAEKGYILTNNHVIEAAAEEKGSSRIDVRLDDGRRFKATIVGRDPNTDLALVQIKADRLKALPLGDSEKMLVGDWVLAIGAPFGWAQTVTQGIISAKGRNPQIVTGYEDFIQTDAAINPGNSGGPLVNMRGEIIGINTAIVTNGLASGYMGIGFAVPSKTVKFTLEALEQGKPVVRGYLGVSIRGLDTFEPGFAKTFGLDTDEGVVVEGFHPDSPDTPARKAGLKQDDVILEYNGQKVNSSTQLQSLVATTVPDTKVDLKVWRDGKAMTIPVVIEKQPEDFFGNLRSAQRPGRDRDRGSDRASASIESLGMTVQTLTPELAKKFGWDDEKDLGAVLVVTKLEPLGEASAGLGIELGDLIQSVQGEPVKSIKALQDALSDEALKEGVRMRIRSAKSGDSRTVFLKVDRDR